MRVTPGEGDPGLLPRVQFRLVWLRAVLDEQCWSWGLQEGRDGLQAVPCS